MSAFQYSQSKEYLARLLANENISIVRNPEANTAWFDLKSRTMTLPVWKTSEDVYDLLTLHEISHALHTPEQGWHHSITVEGLPKSYLNIIEDVRIERLITKRYAGAGRVMRSGYSVLDKRDIFGIRKNKIDVARLPLIDRINIHYKLGTTAAVPFSEEERVWLDKIDLVETWEDVVAICKELYAAENSKLSEQTPPETQPFSLENDEDEDNSFDDESEQQESTPALPEENAGDDSDSSDNESSEEQTTESDESEPNDSNKQENPAGKPATEKTTLNPLDSYTDNEYRKNFEAFEQSILDKQESGYAYHNIGYVDYTTFMIDIEHVRALMKRRNVGYCSKFIADFVNQHKDVVNNMVKEFESKKSAMSVARQQYSKSGRLDTKKVFKYQISEDIFRRNVIQNKGKNHGMIMLFDWSGSMNRQLYDTFVQTAILAMACQKLGIPFSVRLFSDNYSSRGALGFSYLAEHENKPNGVLINRDLSLIEVLKTTPKERDFLADLSNFAAIVCRNAYSMKKNIDNREVLDELYLASRKTYDFELGGTPLNDALIVLDRYIADFNRKHNLEITNLVVLTDGDSNSQYRGRNIDVTDTVTGKKYTFVYYGSKQTNVMYDILRTRHKETLNIIGYYVSSASTINYVCNKYDPENKYTNVFGKVRLVSRNENMMADRFFLVPSSTLDIDDEWDFKTDSTTKVSAVKTSFAKHMKGKKDSRVVVSKFIESIAQKL